MIQKKMEHLLIDSDTNTKRKMFLYNKFSVDGKTIIEEGLCNLIHTAGDIKVRWNTETPFLITVYIEV